MKKVVLLLMFVLAFGTSFAQTKQKSNQACSEKDLRLTITIFRLAADYLYYLTRDPFYWLFVECREKQLSRRYCHVNSLSVDDAVQILIKKREKYIQELEKPDV